MSYQQVNDNRKLYSIKIKTEFILDKFIFTSRNNFRSKYQRVEEMPEVRWQMEMIQKRVPTKRDPFYWGIYVSVDSSAPLECDVSFCLTSEESPGMHKSIVNCICCNGYYVLVHKCCSFDRASAKFGIEDFILHDDLFVKKSGFFTAKKAKLTVLITFRYTSKANEELYQPAQMIQHIDWLKNHGQKNFKFIVENNFVQVHKFVLSHESTVFTAMFENPNFKETQTGEMVITDCCWGTVNAVVNFCYGEDISEFIKHFTVFAIEVLMFADKYDMKRLKTAFEEYYSKKLTNENVAKILVAAHKVNAAALKDKG